MMLVVMIPSNAYAGTAIAAMDNVFMSQQYQYQDISFNFNDSNTQLPRKGAGPLYDDIFFTDESVYWTRKVDKDGTGYVTPGERPTGSFGFCVDLKKSKLLGAVRKGDLYADCTVRARNYDLDGDISRSVIIPYPIGGYYVKEYASADHDNNSSWGDVTVNSPQITKDAYYLVFSAYGERKGGAANKNLNFDVNSIYGKITDKVGPKVVSISDTATVNGKQYIRQDINKNDPSIYITMDEDCKFNAGSKVLLETNKFGIHEMSAELIYVGEVSSDDSTGHVTYKFRIKLTDPYDSLNGYHYYKVKLDILNTYDTMGNFISQSRQELNNIQCNKFIDMRQPNNTYMSDYKINEMKITDEYGLSSVSY
ncbi:MAG: hypothetical protein PHW90_04545, partial [Bacilli bacterium]|nr:hypothetical protein [Bacilli bacterium]